MPKKVTKVVKRRKLDVPRASSAPVKKSSSFKTLMLVCVIIILGVLFRNDFFGQIMIVGYGVGALLFRIESLTTFKLAIVMFVSVAVLAVRNNYSLAQTFATYAFLLMIIAIMCAFGEQYRLNKHELQSQKSVKHKTAEKKLLV